MTPLRLLLVDDEEEFLDVFALRLQARGFAVETAATGEEALDKVERQGFDVVVLDLTMPGIDGFETLKRLKAWDADLQVIVLTGHSRTSREEVALDLGAVDIVAKPASFPELLAKISSAGESRRQLLARRQGSQS